MENKEIERPSLDNFYGSYDVCVDNKSRIALPRYFSNKLLEKHELILTRTFNACYPIIAVFPSVDAHKLGMDFYSCMSEFDFADKVNLWNLNSMVSPMDSGNRITLRGNKDFIPDNKMITILGQGNWFELWKTEEFTEYKEYLEGVQMKLTIK